MISDVCNRPAVAINVAKPEVDRAAEIACRLMLTCSFKIDVLKPQAGPQIGRGEERLSFMFPKHMHGDGYRSCCLGICSQIEFSHCPAD